MPKTRMPKAKEFVTLIYGTERRWMDRPENRGVLDHNHITAAVAGVIPDDTITCGIELKRLATHVFLPMSRQMTFHMYFGASFWYELDMLRGLNKQSSFLL